VGTNNATKKIGRFKKKKVVEKKIAREKERAHRDQIGYKREAEGSVVGVTNLKVEVSRA